MYSNKTLMYSYIAYKIIKEFLLDIFIFSIFNPYLITPIVTFDIFKMYREVLSTFFKG